MVHLQQSRMRQMRTSSLIALGEPPFKVSPTLASRSETSSLGSPSRISQMSSSTVICSPGFDSQFSRMTSVTHPSQRQACRPGCPSGRPPAPPSSLQASFQPDSLYCALRGLKYCNTISDSIGLLKRAIYPPTYRTCRCVTDDTGVLFITP